MAEPCITLTNISTLDEKLHLQIECCVNGIKKVFQPIVGFVREVQICKLLKQGGVADSVKGLAEVQRDEVYVWIAGQHICNGLEHGNNGGICGSSWNEGKLVIKVQLGRW